MERLDKFLSDAGIASRRELKAILKSGAVRLNGEPVTDGAVKLDPASDRVTYRGEPVEGPRRVVLLLHKPFCTIPLLFFYPFLLLVAYSPPLV